jgi:hypothetical protein
LCQFQYIATGAAGELETHWLHRHPKLTFALRKRAQRTDIVPAGNADQQCAAPSLRTSERIIAQVNFVTFLGSQMADASTSGPHLVLFTTVCTAVSQFRPHMAVTVRSSRMRAAQFTVTTLRGHFGYAVRSLSSIRHQRREQRWQFDPPTHRRRAFSDIIFSDSGPAAIDVQRRAGDEAETR